MANVTTEIGVTGLASWSGQIREDFLRELQGLEGYKRYREMAWNSPVVAALLLAIEQSIRGVTWSFTSDQGEDDPRLELVNEARENMSLSWNDHIIEALTMLPYGWSYFEAVYERVGGRLLWHKFAPRGQDTLHHWETSDTGALGGMWQQTWPRFVPTLLPIEKCLLYRARVEKGNPEGRSILRSAWIPYYYLKNISQIEAIGIERDLAGLPMVELPEGADTSETSGSDWDKASKLVRRVRNDQEAGLVIPNGWKFSLVSTGGSRAIDTDTVIRRYETRILMSCLAQFLALGQDGTGSLALSKDSTDFFTMSVNATADIIAETFTKYAVPRLLALNGQDPDGIKLEHSPAGDTDLTALGTFLQTIGDLLTWTAADEAWLRGAAKLPELAPEEIQAERDMKQESALALAQSRIQQMQDKQGEQPEVEPKEDDEMMGADLFAAGRAPDDAERRTWEGRYTRLLRRFFAEQKARVVKGAKKLR